MDASGGAAAPAPPRAAAGPTRECWKCGGKGTVPFKPQRRDVRKSDPAPGEVKRQLQQRKCAVCGGRGTVERKRGRSGAAEATAAKRAARSLKTFENWVAPGPRPATDVLSLQSSGSLPAAAVLPADCAWDPLAGHWSIAQPVARHRYSTDDVITAWLAFREARRVEREAGPAGAEAASRPACADIGCGLGSALLMVQWALPGSRSVGLEAQETRMALARQSVLANGCGGRCVVLGGDLRVTSSQAAAARAVTRLFGGAAAAEGLEGPGAEGPPETAVFDLVTGTPPYFDPAVAGRPADGESSACLFEERGGVEAYCAAAAALLRPAGVRPLSLRVSTRQGDNAASAGAAGAAAGQEAGETAAGVDCHGAALPYPPVPRPLAGLEGLEREEDGVAFPGKALTGPARGPADAPPEWWERRGGRFVVVETALAAGRVYAAAHAAGLAVEQRLDVVGRVGKPPLIVVCVLARAEEAPAAARESPSCGLGRVSGSVWGEQVRRLDVRGPPPAAARTPAYRRVLAEMGKPSD